MNCIICSEPGSLNYATYPLCDWCATNLPGDLCDVAGKTKGEALYYESQSNGGGCAIPLEALNFTYTQDTWMLFPPIIERLKDLNNPAKIKILVDNPRSILHTTGDILKIISSDPNQNTLDVRKDSSSYTYILLIDKIGIHWEFYNDPGKNNNNIKGDGQNQKHGYSESSWEFL